MKWKWAYGTLELLICPLPRRHKHLQKHRSKRVRIMDPTLARRQSNPIHRRSAFALAFLACHSRRESASSPTRVPHLQHSLTVFKVGYFVSIKLFICNIRGIPHCLRPKTLNLVRSSQARFGGQILWKSLSGEFISIPKEMIRMATTCEDRS